MATGNRNKTAKGLPKVYAARNPADGSPILIKRGKIGFLPLTGNASPEECNEAWGVSKEQAQAMLVGSISGWHVIGADPANYV